MAKPKFSVIIPVYSPYLGVPRLHLLKRAIRSILNQQYPHWEMIIVNDGCEDEVGDYLHNPPEELKDKRVKIIHQPPLNRAIARNAGMDVATGDWICWLDSDDEYSTNYFRSLSWAIKDNPDIRVFNYGSLVYRDKYDSFVRVPFRPAIEGDGHEWFKAGQIATGSFCFERKLWADNPEKYRIPDEASPYEFAAKSGYDMKLDPGRDDIEFKSEEAFLDGKMRVGLSLGNPWGDDFLQFYKLTRDNHSKALDVALYIQYPRSSEDDQEYFHG